ncbi:MmcQ-like protein [Nonlabens spongiae]|uniref:MmcQ-like protein n=1 Tax=Nonlabens spongiae TaxID=331648 RepID=A0A1W6ML39_9FLAO|nr:MmcQ/YjbR family DNA-binding protein [Nonlabens spongiae]ARN78303.1 MmcQ-like protein [Nonlabens spongiae]
MFITDLQDYCESKKGVTSHFPFDNDTLVYKVMNKMFCLTSLEKWENGAPSVNLKCDPETAIELRAEYGETVTGGYHMHKKHWNTICINRDMQDDAVFKWIDHSYDLIVAKLPKKDRDLLKNL